MQMKRTLLLLMLVMCVEMTYAQGEKKDTTQTDTTLQGVKMKEVVVTKDKRLPIFVSPQTKEQTPHVKSVSDIIGRKATDMIMHPFAFKSRKEERRRRKVLKQMWEYEHVKTNNELLREALIREGIDPDSLMRAVGK